MLGVVSIPSWYPDTETKPAPMPLLLVQAFVNTLDFDTGRDLLGDSDTARGWLADAGLIARQTRVTEDELEHARAVREAIRSLLQGSSADLAALRAVAGRHELRLTVSEGGPFALENPRRETLDDALFELLLIIRRAQEDGSWSRLKACANPDCAWAFYDRSRNQQGNWCDMAVCGNRLKNRQLRARRRG